MSYSSSASQLPWLWSPIILHSSRDPAPCEMTAEQCAFIRQYWLYWYESDHRYALPTLALFLVAILLCSLGHIFSAYAPERLRASAVWSRLVAVGRLLVYTKPRRGLPSVGALFLGGVGLVFFLAMTLGPRPYYWPDTHELSFGHSPPLATRAGFMALACLPMIVALGSKASFVTAVTGVSHERLTRWHAWASWAMFVLGLVHSFPFIVYHRWAGDLVYQWNNGGTWVTGVLMLVFEAWLTFASLPSLRSRAYEFFKAMHFACAAAFIVFFFLHCQSALSSWDYFIATGVLYTLSWLYGVLRTLVQHGLRCRAQLVCVSDRLLCISVTTTKAGTVWRPGQHVFLRFLALGPHALTAHPFTIASVPRSSSGPMVFYVAPRGGLTARLTALARRQPRVSVPVLIDGPYGGLPARWFAGFDRCLVVAGGAGVGLTLALAEHHLRDARADAVLQVVLATRDDNVRQWYAAALDDMAASIPKKDQQPPVAVHIYETAQQTSATAEKTHETLDVQFFAGRPDLAAILRQEIQTVGVSVGISVCGPPAMVDDVGAVAAAAQQRIVGGDGQMAREVWFHAEAFSF